MKIVFSRTLAPALRWVERVLFASSLAMLACCALAIFDAWTFQRTELDRSPMRPPALQSGPPTPPAAGGVLGRLEISRLGLSAVVVEGTSRSNLRRAVGHIRGTGLPGQPGNIGLSGHRDTFFRPLKDILRNDTITLRTPGTPATAGRTYRYRVVSTRVVAPTEVSVLEPGSGQILTLVTCYPFYFVGFAPERFVVRAERTGGESR
ncbi:MAG: class D sortase [Bryobacteraceae bacterium]|nr:class D sortase [Bryobacteraceae bacterium]